MRAPDGGWPHLYGAPGAKHAEYDPIYAMLVSPTGLYTVGYQIDRPTITPGWFVLCFGGFPVVGGGNAQNGSVGCRIYRAKYAAEAWYTTSPNVAVGDRVFVCSCLQQPEPIPWGRPLVMFIELYQYGNTPTAQLLEFSVHPYD